MKRSKALQPLSRDHHQALAVALTLRRADAGHPLVVRVLVDHVEIRERAQRLERVAPDAAPGELNELGERLAEHVRIEERELFPLIEAALPADAAASLAAALAHTEDDRADG